MRFRGVRRAVALAFALAGCFLKYWMMRVRAPLTLERRARWLHSACRSVVSAFGIETHVEGIPPACGLVVSNHLSYLDIVIFAANLPCFFVSKKEVEDWPYFGKAAIAGATLFLDRSSRTSTIVVAQQMTERLTLPVPVLLFPEGTSSDGAEVLRFHSTLFEPAVRAQAQVTAAAVRYVLHDGTEERDLCWFDDTMFLPHLWKTLCTRGFSAQVCFGEPRVYGDRRTAAQVTHEEVTAMRATSGIEPVASEPQTA